MHHRGKQPSLCKCNTGDILQHEKYQCFHYRASIILHDRNHLNLQLNLADRFILHTHQKLLIFWPFGFILCKAKNINKKITDENDCRKALKLILGQHKLKELPETGNSNAFGHIFIFLWSCYNLQTTTCFQILYPQCTSFKSIALIYLCFLFPAFQAVLTL